MSCGARKERTIKKNKKYIYVKKLTVVMTTPYILGTKWVKDNIIKLGPNSEFNYLPPSIFAPLYMIVIILLENKTDVLNESLKYLQSKVANLSESLTKKSEVIPSDKIVITQDPNMKNLYSGQFYIQLSKISEKDFTLNRYNLSLSQYLVNILVSKDTIGNLAFYSDKKNINVYFVMFDLESLTNHPNSDSLKNLDLVSHNGSLKDETVKKWGLDWSQSYLSIQNFFASVNYREVHLLYLSHYESVEFLVKNCKSKLYLHVYDETDLDIVSKLFETDISIKSNVTIVLSLGWINRYTPDYNSVRTFDDVSLEISDNISLKYMNLILKMTQYKMRHGNTKIDFNINKDNLNIERLSENNLYFDCVQVLLNEYVTKTKPKTKDYSACLLSIENLKKLNSTMKDIKKTATENTYKIISMMNIMNTTYSGKEKTLNTKYETLEQQIGELSNTVKDNVEILKTLKTLESKIDSNNDNHNENLAQRSNENRSSYNEDFSSFLQELQSQFKKMEFDSQNTENSVRLLYGLLVLFILFFIILINIRTTKKKK